MSETPHDAAARALQELDAQENYTPANARLKDLYLPRAKVAITAYLQACLADPATNRKLTRAIAEDATGVPQRYRIVAKILEALIDD